MKFILWLLGAIVCAALTVAPGQFDPVQRTIFVGLVWVCGVMAGRNLERTTTHD
jgi:hypothetical protein